VKPLARLGEAVAQGHACEFALIDRQLPGMDGLELARAIKGAPALASTQLILLTGPGATWRCPDGADGWLCRIPHQAGA
jgi:CheY-like chemotaxis protein